MWLKITEIFVFCVLLLLYHISQVSCHLPSYMSTPSSPSFSRNSEAFAFCDSLQLNKVEQFCLQSETCIHDTIQICGKMGDEKRTFLDLCDLLEYACDTNQIYTHVDDMKDCPLQKDPR